MSDTDLPREDDVLRRMLNTPPKPHKEKVDEGTARKAGSGVRKGAKGTG